VLNKLSVHLSDVVIVQSNHMKNDLIDTFSLDYIDKIIKINNPVDIENLYKNIKVIDLPTCIKFFFNQKKYIFVSVGRLDFQKNYKDLIQAFSIAHLSNRDIGLVILGEGGYRSDLERLSYQLGVNESVLIAGFIDNPEIVVSRANCFVSSSLYEGMSNAILEALSLGIPVIATDCPSGIGEVIINRRSGFLVDLDQNLIEGLSDEMLAISTGEREIDLQEIKEMTRKSFDIKSVSKKYEEIFR